VDGNQQVSATPTAPRTLEPDAVPGVSHSNPPPFPRRHDLDALRAFAMLLGIALHGSLSFIPLPWPAQDTQQNGLFMLFFMAVHGFRMPLFFLVSGFFTAMLWQRRGIKALLKQRFQRIVIPLALSLATIGPAVHWVSEWAFEEGKQGTQTVSVNLGDGLIAAVRRQDIEEVRREIDQTEDINQADAYPGITPLAWATLHGNQQIAELLIERGADPNARNADGGSALHSAALMGRPQMVEFLLDRGADPTAVNGRDELPAAAAQFDSRMSMFLASMLRVELRSREALVAGRRECRKLLATDYAPTPTTVRNAYWAAINSPRLAIVWSNGAEPFHLIQTPVFFHLWFLWFLCWYVVIFAGLFWLADRFEWQPLPRWAIASPVRYLWFVPLTLIPQWFMGIVIPVFGPDTSVGILPQPHVLLYYAIFFGFGALYFNFPADQQLGRWWWITIPVSLLVLLPLGLFTIRATPLTAPVQALFAWTMTCGSIGICRNLLSKGSSTMRYISDSAYWLYLAHVPLVIGVQAWIRPWPLPALVKFALVCALVTAILLVTYDLLVRYSWLGRLLNGPRQRPSLGAAEA